METKEFCAQGYYCVSNCGGYEVEISTSGDSARIKDTVSNKVSDWFEIEYISDPEDENEDSDMIAVIDPEGYNIRLDQVMRINQ